MSQRDDARDAFDATDEERKQLAGAIHTRALTFHRAAPPSLDHSGRLKRDAVPVVILANASTRAASLLLRSYIHQYHAQHIDTTTVLVDHSSCDADSDGDGGSMKSVVEPYVASVNDTGARLYHTTQTFPSSTFASRSVTAIAIDASITGKPEPLQESATFLSFPLPLDDSLNEKARELAQDLPELLQ